MTKALSSKKVDTATEAKKVEVPEAKIAEAEAVPIASTETATNKTSSVAESQE